MASQTRTRRRWSIEPGYPDGWTVEVCDREADTCERRYYGGGGGEWEVNHDGTLGPQIAGKHDVRAPAAEPRFRRWVKRRFER